MLIKSKYKIARRLGAPIFEKTQTQKFSLSLAQRGEKTRKHPRTFTDFKRQLIEKQKVRFTYLTSERQLKRYVNDVLSKKGIKQDARLFETLERRLDNVAYRLGFGPTRLSVRQLVSHGHLCVNGRRVDVPSYKLSVGDIVGIRPGSLSKKPFAGLDEKLKEWTPPAWLSLDAAKKEGKVVGAPKLDPAESGLDFNVVLEFYKR